MTKKKKSAFDDKEKAKKDEAVEEVAETVSDDYNQDAVVPPSVIADERFWFGVVVGIALSFVYIYVSGGMMGGATKDRSAMTLNEYAVEVAKDAKVKKRAFEKCIQGSEMKQVVADQVNEAQAAGIGGTPYSVITDGEKQVAINGAQPKANIIALLDNFADAEPAEKEVPGLRDTDHVKGAENAKYTIIEYSDIDCPFCKRFHTSMMQIIEERDDVQWAYRHLPLDRLHPDARFKAEAAECAAQNGGDDAFWKFLDAMILAEK